MAELELLPGRCRSFPGPIQQGKPTRRRSRRRAMVANRVHERIVALACGGRHAPRGMPSGPLQRPGQRNAPSRNSNVRSPVRHQRPARRSECRGSHSHRSPRGLARSRPTEIPAHHPRCDPPLKCGKRIRRAPHGSNGGIRGPVDTITPGRRFRRQWRPRTLKLRRSCPGRAEPVQAHLPHRQRGTAATRSSE